MISRSAGLNGTSPERLRGNSSPLGAAVVPGGVSFSVSSRDCAGIGLLLFDRVDDAQNLPEGFVNYWGYSPIPFFVPHAEYSFWPDPLGPARMVR